MTDSGDHDLREAESHIRMGVRNDSMDDVRAGMEFLESYIERKHGGGESSRLSEEYEGKSGSEIVDEVNDKNSIGESSSSQPDSPNGNVTGSSASKQGGEPPKPEPDAWSFVVEEAQLDPDKNHRVVKWSDPDNPHSIEGIRHEEHTINDKEPLFSQSTIQNYVKKLLSRVASKALTYVSSTIIKDVDGSIEEQILAIKAIQQGDYEEAIDILGDNIKHMLERQDMWKLHMEEVADEQVEELEEVFDPE